jgi:hypothetical protein
MKISELEEGRYNNYDNNRSGFGRPERDMSDESNLLYIYKNDRVQQAMISNRHEREARAQGYRDTIEQALKLHGIIKSKFKPGKWVQKQGDSWPEVFPFGKPDTTEGLAGAAMAKLPAFLNTIGKDTQSIAKIQDQINQRIMSAGAGNPATTHLSNAHNLLSQMYKNPTEEQAKAFYQAIQKANGAGIKESATVGATSSANIGTVDAPHLSPGKARGKKSYIGSPGKSGTKAPPQPKVNQPKNKDGTAKNGLDIKGASLFGGPPVKRR